jgi:uncharacterized membrane protein YbjE (DUF340 family)
MISGIVCGIFIHHKPKLIRINDRFISTAIYILLFLLGISVGLNKTIIQNIGTLGFQALIITVGAISGSVLMSWLIFRIFFSPEQDNGLKDEE